MKLLLTKCVFGARKIDYLGYVIEAGQMKIKEETCGATKKIEVAREIIELRRELGAFTYEMGAWDGRDS